MLLDEIIPVFDVSERHAVRIAAPPERAWAAIHAVTPAEVPLFRWLFALRALPERLSGRSGRCYDMHAPMLGQVEGGGFAVLGERAGTEIALGIIGRFWHPTGDLLPPTFDLDGFRAFDRPGWAKAAFDFRVEPDPRGARVATETRVLCIGAGARRAFRLYWSVIHPGSALIRRTWLRAIRRRAERAERAQPDG